MIINLYSLYAGPLGSYGPGVCEVPDAIAKGLIEAEVAVPVVETRVLSPAVDAAKPEDELVETRQVVRGSRKAEGKPPK